MKKRRQTLNETNGKLLSSSSSISRNSNNNTTTMTKKKGFPQPTTSTQHKLMKPKNSSPGIPQPTTSPQHKLMKPKNSSSGKHTYIKGDDSAAAYAKHEQHMREISASMYRDSKYYGPEDELRACIWPGGKFPWTEKSSGISWIGVNGTDTTCVVSMSNGKPPRRAVDRTQLSVDDVLTTSLADMGDKSSEFRGLAIAQSSKEAVPFAVVSVAPAPRGSGQECQEQASRAINFLEAELRDRSSLTFEETAKIAVCALKCMLGPKFKSNQIEARGFGKWEVPNGRMEAIVADVLLGATTKESVKSSFSSLSVCSTSDDKLILGQFVKSFDDNLILGQ